MNAFKAACASVLDMPLCTSAQKQVLYCGTHTSQIQSERLQWRAVSGNRDASQKAHCLIVDVGVRLPPGQVVAHYAVRGVTDSSPVKDWRALQRLFGKVVRPEADIAPGEARSDKGYQLATPSACASHSGYSEHKHNCPSVPQCLNPLLNVTSEKPASIPYNLVVLLNTKLYSSLSPNAILMSPKAVMTSCMQMGCHCWI